MGSFLPAIIRLAMPLLLVCGLIPAGVQDSPLNGLTDVRVAVDWPAGSDAERGAVQTGVELKLRQAGLHVLTAADHRHTRLLIRIGGIGAAIPLVVELDETTYLERDTNSFNTWMDARIKDTSPLTSSEIKRHTVRSWAAATWLMFGVAQDVQAESVQSIIARYKAEIQNWQLTTPAAVPVKEHMMDLEVQAATANAKCNTSYVTVRDTINSFVDAFINDWVATNPKPR